MSADKRRGLPQINKKMIHKKTSLIKFLICVIWFLICVISVCNAANWRAFRKNETRSGYAREVASPPLIHQWNSYEKLSKTLGSIVSSPAVADGKVFIGTRDGKIYCFDAFTGEKIWEYQTGGWVDSSPSVYQGTVYVGSRDGKLYALDVSTPVAKWTYSAGGAILSSPIVVDGYLYFAVGYPEKKVVCLNAQNREVKWTYQTGGYVYSSPAIEGNNLYIGANDGKFYCLNISNGELVWSKQTYGSIYFSAMTIGDDVVYGIPGDDEPYLYAFNLQDEQIKWKTKLLNSGPVYVSSIVLGEDKIFVGCGAEPHYIFALNKNDGSLLWKEPVTVGNASASGICSSPALVDVVLYVGSAEEGDLYALDASSGTFIWWEDLGSEIVSSPAVSNGWVYIGTTEGILYAYKASEIVSISSPDDGESVSGEVSIRAYITNSSTVNPVNTYEITYGLGENPKFWMPISRGTRGQVDGEKLGSWNTNELSQAIYTIRLRVNDSQEARVTVNVGTPTAYYGTYFDTYVWPNPVYPSKNRYASFKGKIPAGQNVDVEIRIFTIVGELVRALKDFDDTGTPMRNVPGGWSYNFDWNLRNDESEMVASGVYIYIVYIDGKPQKGKIKKIAIIK